MYVDNSTMFASSIWLLCIYILCTCMRSELFLTSMFQKTCKSKYMDKIALFLRRLVLDETMAAITPLIVWYFDTKKGLFIVCIAAISEIINGVLKWIHCRPRPFWELQNIKNLSNKWETDFSFPSSHAQSITSIIFAVIYEFSESFSFTSIYHQLFVFILVLIPFSCGISRIYLGVHYLSCIVFGWCMGAYLVILFKWIDVENYIFYKLDYQQRLQFAIYMLFSIYTVFYSIKNMLVPTPFTSSESKKFKKTAIANTARKESNSDYTVCQRSYSKYDFQIWSLFGGLIGINLSVHKLEIGELSFLDENCFLQHHNTNNVKRLLFGGFILYFVLFPITFILSSLDICQKFKLSSYIRKIGFFCFGYWMCFGCAFYSKSLFKWECSIFECNPNQILSPFVSYYDQLGIFRDDDICSSTEYIYSNDDTDERGWKLFFAEEAVIIPHTIKDIQNEVINASIHQYKLRARGSFFSPLHLHSQQYYENNCSENVKLVWMKNFIKYQKFYDETTKETLIVVGAGLTLHSNKYLNISFNDSLIGRMWSDGFALPNIPGNLQQTIGGIISTGSLGGSAKYNLMSSLYGIKYVNGEGVLKQAWKNTSAIDNFYGIGVSMGLTGIIYEIILKPINYYCVTGEAHQIVDPFQKNKDKWIDLNRFNDYSRNYILYIPEMDKNVYSYSFFDNRTISNADKCHQNLRYININEFRLFALYSIFAQQPQCFTKYGNSDFCSHKFVNFMYNSNLTSSERNQYQRCFKYLSEFKYKIHLFHHYQSNGLSKEISAACLLPLLNSRTFNMDDPYIYRYYTDISPEHTLINITRIHLMEIAVSVQYIHNFISVLSDLYHENGYKMTNFFLGNEVYFGNGPNHFWMSPFYKENGLRFNVFFDFTKNMNQSNIFTFYWKIWDKMINSNIPFALHWGKILPTMNISDNKGLNLMRKIRSGFTNIDKFKALCDAEDPKKVFRTKYWERTLWE